MALSAAIGRTTLLRPVPGSLHLLHLLRASQQLLIARLARRAMKTKRIQRWLARGVSGARLARVAAVSFSECQEAWSRMAKKARYAGRVRIVKHVHTSQLAAVKIVPKHALMSSRMSINEAGAKVSFPYRTVLSLADVTLHLGRQAAFRHRARDRHHEAHRTSQRPSLVRCLGDSDRIVG